MLEAVWHPFWGATLQVSHLVSDIYYQSTGIYRETKYIPDPSLCGANLVQSAQKYKFLTSSPDSLTHGQHTDCLRKSWHPVLIVLAETFTEHNPRRKEWQSLLGVKLCQKMFWFRKLQSGVNLTQGRKACVSQSTYGSPYKSLYFYCISCAVSQKMINACTRLPLRHTR